MFSIIISEKGGAERKETFDKNEINVGRVQGNDLMLPKGNVSKHHARLLYRDGRFIVTDLKSTNGTYVNGRKIAQATIVREGDKIYIGDFILRVDMGGAAAQPGPEEQAPMPQPGAPMPMSGPPPMPAPMPPGMPPLPQAQPPQPMIAQGPLGMPPMPQPQPPVPAGMHPMPRPPTPGIAMPVPARPQPLPPAPRDSGGAVSHYPLERDPDDSDAHMPAPIAGQGPGPRLPSAPRIPSALAPSNAPLAINRSTLPLQTTPAPAATARPPSMAPSPVITSPSAPPAARSQPASSGRVLPRESPAQAGRRLALVTLVDRVADATDLTILDKLAHVDDATRSTIERVVSEQAKSMGEEEGVPDGIDLEQLRKEAIRELVGLGVITSLLDDDDISEIHCLRHDQVLVVKAGALSLADGAYTNDQALGRTIARLAAQSGQPVATGEVCVVRHLARGAHMIAFLPPASAQHALVIRKRRRVEMSLEDFVRLSAASRAMATFLEGCLAARANMLVCGSSASASSTFLGALASSGSPGDRVVVVQEEDEITVSHAQVLRLHGAKHDDVLRAAARIRPDRWIVGALAGRAVASALQAVAEGAEGVLASASAPTLRQGLARLVTQLLLAQPGLSPEAARECVAESFDIAVEVHQLPDGRYRVSRITELAGTDAKGLVVRDVFVATDGGEGHLATGVVPRIVNEFAARGVRVDTNLFKKPGR